MSSDCRRTTRTDAEVLESLTKLYGITRYGRLALSRDLAFRNCAVLAFSFARFLLRRGYPPAQVCVVEVRGCPDFPDLHPDWSTRREAHGGSGLQAVNHYMTQVEVRNTYGPSRATVWLYDWSYRQFESVCWLPHVQLAECCAWKKFVRYMPPSEILRFKHTTGPLCYKTNLVNDRREANGLERL